MSVLTKVTSVLHGSLKGSDQSNKLILLGQLYRKLNSVQQYVFVDTISISNRISSSFFTTAFLSSTEIFKCRIFLEMRYKNVKKQCIKPALVTQDIITVSKYADLEKKNSSSPFASSSYFQEYEKNYI